MLSKRLKCIFDYVRFEVENVCDIGCDHGYILIELAKENKNRKYLGIENKIGPYTIFQNNIKKNNLESVVFSSLSDGLSEVSNDYNIVIIAGMGFFTIEEIIKKDINKLENINYFIIDCHNEEYKCRSFFNSLGYTVEDEMIIYEKNIFYNIIKYKKEKESLSELELKYGKYFKKNHELKLKKLNSLLKTKNNLIKSLKNGDRLKILNEEINDIKEAIEYENTKFNS